MKKLLVGFAAVVAFSNCGLSPADACKEAMKVTCNKMYTCYTGADLDGIKSMFGATEADCVTKMNQQSNCDAKEQTACEANKTYDSSAANSCINDWKALSCDSLKAGTKVTSCDNVCK